MTWGIKNLSTGNYTAKFTYSREASIYNEEGLHIATNMYGHWFKLNNFTIGNIKAGNYEGITEAIPIITEIEDNENGTITWHESKLRVINGIIVGYWND